MNERKNIPAELYPLKFINLSLSKLILSELIAELMIVRIISEHKDHSVFLDKYSHPSVKQSGVLSVCLSNSPGAVCVSAVGFNFDLQCDPYKGHDNRLISLNKLF